MTVRNYLGLSHLRVDHVGNVGLFPEASVLLQRAEDEAVRPANVDLEQSRRSIETAKRLERELGATVWLHHDLHAQRAVHTAPRHYQ
ncbi:MAG: hypothetical protein R2736_03800 [Solirubrobacterales bacterium]